jgi:hypothetical protein
MRFPNRNEISWVLMDIFVNKKDSIAPILAADREKATRAGIEDNRGDQRRMIAGAGLKK